MTLELQYKIKNNQNYTRYIRQNSHWYKILNREPNMFKQFEEEVKTNYRLRTTDKLSQALDYISFLQTVMTNFK